MMFLAIKIGRRIARKYQVMRKQFRPEVSEEFTIRGLGDFDWDDQRVRCTGIVDRNPGGNLYLVEIV